MNWTDVYLFCFLFGFFFSLASVISGHLHLDLHGHGHSGGGVPNGHGGHDGFQHGHAHHSHAHQGHGGHDGGRAELPIFNMGTLSAFLAWFGGTGYLATHYYGAWFLTAFGFAVVAGLIGAYLVFLFVNKVLMREKDELDPAAFEMVGVLGTVTGSLRAGGTGEITYSQNGMRRAAPIRSEDGSAIPSGIEVVVTQYRDGIAYVRRWDELTRT